jgi:hypothetical protein
MKLAQYLTLAKMTHRQFAAKLGVHHETVRVWLMDDGRMPQGRFLRRVILLTGGDVTANDFLPPPKRKIA